MVEYVDISFFGREGEIIILECVSKRKLRYFSIKVSHSYLAPECPWPDHLERSMGA